MSVERLAEITTGATASTMSPESDIIDVFSVAIDI